MSGQPLPGKKPVIKQLALPRAAPVAHECEEAVLDKILMEAEDHTGEGGDE